MENPEWNTQFFSKTETRAIVTKITAMAEGAFLWAFFLVA